MTILRIDPDNRILTKDQLYDIWWLLKNDSIFFSSYDSETKTWGEWQDKPCLIMNDTFAYACADAEDIEIEDLHDLVESVKKFDYDGAIAYVALKRNREPLEERQTVRYKEAKEWWKLVKLDKDLSKLFYAANIRL